MKYQIVREVNGNGKVHFEVLLHVEVEGFLWNHREWQSVKTVQYSKEWQCDTWQTKKFDTFEEAEQCVQSFDRAREVVKEGEFTGERSPRWNEPT